jgi:hypothetical protein
MSQSKLNTAQQLYQMLGVPYEGHQRDTRISGSHSNPRNLSRRQHEMRMRRLAKRKLTKKQQALADNEWTEIMKGRKAHLLDLARRNESRGAKARA